MFVIIYDIFLINSNRNTEYYSFILTSNYVFEDTWKNRAEQESKAQAYDEEMIREAKRSEVEEEIRRQVDVLMREELDLLKIVSNLYCYKAINKDCITNILDFTIHNYYRFIIVLQAVERDKGKKGKISKKRKKGKKKASKKKGKKKDKDLTPDRTTEVSFLN